MNNEECTGISQNLTQEQSISSIRGVGWNRFVTRELSVGLETIGGKHEFTFNGGSVRIRLPGLDKLPVAGALPKMNSALNIWKWENEKPAAIAVSYVDVEVDIPQEIKIPGYALQSTAINYQLPDQLEHNINSILKNCRHIAEGAFDLWIRMLRWKTNHIYIGRPDVSDFRIVHSGRGTDITKEDCEKLLKTASSLLAIQGNNKEVPVHLS